MNTELPGHDGFGRWRKSSFSNPNGNECVEVAWRKSSFSEPNGNECVEVAFSQVVVGLRDSKNPEGPKLNFGHSPWLAFTTAISNATA
jgi:hypothetical protein